MPTFSRFIKIFIFIFAVFIFLNISGCGNNSEESTNSGSTVDPDLIYHETDVKTEPTTEIISGTIPFSQNETSETVEVTEIPETSETSVAPETSDISETSEIKEETTEPEETAAADLYVITPSGKKYHYPTCRTVKSIKQYLSKEEAEQLGYEPCKICNPK